MKISKKELKELIVRTISENRLFENEEPTISIEKIEPDERRPNFGDDDDEQGGYKEKKPASVSVNYQINDGDRFIEITGTLIPYHSGRDWDFEFEPGFVEGEDQEYFDENWEKIEQQILDKYYSMPIQWHKK